MNTQFTIRPAKPEEAKALVARLGEEYLAWFEYVLSRKGA